MMTWHPVRELSPTEVATGNPEFVPLQQVWLEQKARLEDAGLLDAFIRRLVREWSVETGILERLYSIDRGVTQVLIEQGFDDALIPHGATDQDAEHVIEVLRDHEESADLVFDVVKDERPLSVGLIKELHSLITRHQDVVEGQDQFGRRTHTTLERGEFQRLANNPTRPDGELHEYRPPVHVGSEMDRLIELHHRNLESEVPTDVAAAWLHHRFSQIHPFADGNGRVARAITNIVFIQAGWFPLVVRADDRADYIGALEAADRGDLGPLVRLFGAIQKRAFIQALGLADSVRREEATLAELLDAIGDELGSTQAERERQYREVEPIADSLLDIAIEQLGLVSARLAPLLENAFVQYRRNGAEGADWNRFTIILAAKELDYFANLDSYACWTRLRLRNDAGQWEILVSLHGPGQQWRGGRRWLDAHRPDREGRGSADPERRHPPERQRDLPAQLSGRPRAGEGAVPQLVADRTPDGPAAVASRIRKPAMSACARPARQRWNGASAWR
jgi:Fic family protein